MTTTTPARRRAVVLLSGGLDSTTALTLAVRKHERQVLPISFDYGQSHGPYEIEAAANVVAEFRRLAPDRVAERVVVRIPDLLLGGSLTGDAPMPDATYDQLSAQSGPSPTYVPFRNGTFLSIATAIALQWDATEVWAGMHAEDAAGWAYPDCTPEFIGGMANAIYVGTYHQVRLITPLSNMDKTQVLRTAVHWNAPTHLTRSCYADQGTPCGTCPACRGRAHAFAEIGARDAALDPRLID